MSELNSLCEVVHLNDPCRACGADEWLDLHPEDPDGILICGPCFTSVTGIETDRVEVVASA